MSNDQLDRLIALGVDLMVNGTCPFCPPEKPCNSPYCPYTTEEKK